MRWGGNDAPHCIALALIGFGFLTPRSSRCQSSSQVHGADVLDRHVLIVDAAVAACSPPHVLHRIFLIGRRWH
jgi:hypothetical protein